MPSLVMVISILQSTEKTANEQLTGQFENGNLNGKGKMRFANGQIQEGMWSNDKFIG